MYFLTTSYIFLVLQTRYYPAVQIDKHACRKFNYEISACYTWREQNIVRIAIYKFSDVTFVSDTIAYLVHTRHIVTV